MKKLVAVLLATLSVVACSVGLTACSIKLGGSGSGSSSNSSSNSSSVSSEATQAKGVIYEIVDGTAQVVDYTGTKKSVTIKATYEGVAVTKIADNAFKDCAITSVQIPDSVTVIGNSAFYGCASLAEIDIPDSVTSIGTSAFQDCNALTEVVLPDSVTSIGASAFEMCLGLTSITIGANVTSLGDGLFDYCSNLQEITFNGTTDEWDDIEKNTDSWNATFVPAEKVVCSDGEVTL